MISSNVEVQLKQGSCEYQLFKSFGLTRRVLHRTQLYRLRGGRSDYMLEVIGV